MTTVMIILAAAAVGFALALWRHVPAPPILLLMGMALNAMLPVESESTLHDTLLMGLTFLVFVVGAELDFSRVLDQRRTAVKVGLAQFCLLGGIGLAVALAFGFGMHAALYIALALTASSTLLIIGLLRQRQQMVEPFARLLVGALLIQDALVVLLLSAVVHFADGPEIIALRMAAVGVLVLLTIISIRWIEPLLLLRMGLDEESMLLSVLALLFGFMGLAYVMHLPVVVGAFLAGVGMSGFPVGGVVRGQLTSLADFFLAVFFVTLGVSVSLPDLRQLALYAILLSGVMLVAPPLVMIIARRAGLTMRSSIEAAHLLAQCGELSLVVMLLGYDYGHISEELLAAFILLAVVTMSLTPFISTDAATWRLMRRLSGRRQSLPDVHAGNHVLLLGCGSHMRAVLARLVDAGRSVVVIDDDLGVVRTLQQQGVQAVRGDGADFNLLQAVGAHRARVVVSTMRRLQDNERLLQFTTGPQVLVRVFTPEAGERIRALGGTPVVESEAAHDDFLAQYYSA